MIFKCEFKHDLFVLKYRKSHIRETGKGRMGRLKDAFPDMSGFSPRNIKYMRKFAECWPDFEIVQRVVA